jgi:probable DNA metabolism protein
MENTKILIYDGSFNGFLSAVYVAFDEHMAVNGFQKISGQQKSLFAEPYTVQTDLTDAKRVWQEIDRRHYQAAKKIYFAFLSECKGIEMLLYQYIRALFAGGSISQLADYTANLTKIESVADLVAREKKHIERTLIFKKEGGQPAIASIDPHYDVLPLISKYFRSLYPHRAWVIYDRKRSYGLYYHEHSMELLKLSPQEMELLARKNTQQLITASGRQASTGCDEPYGGVRKLHEASIPGSFRQKRAV